MGRGREVGPRVHARTAPSPGTQSPRCRSGKRGAGRRGPIGRRSGCRLIPPSPLSPRQVFPSPSCAKLHPQSGPPSSPHHVTRAHDQSHTRSCARPREARISLRVLRVLRVVAKKRGAPFPDFASSLTSPRLYAPSRTPPSRQHLVLNKQSSCLPRASSRSGPPRPAAPFPSPFFLGALKGQRLRGTFVVRAPARRAAAHTALSPIPRLCRVAPAPISSGMSFRSLPDPSLAQVRKDNRRDGPPTSLRAPPT
jgi:hypothetical protein